MFKNYFKIAWRTLKKQRMYSAIKIGGFALSIAACLLIALYIKDELSYDRFYPTTNRIYRITGEYNNNGKLETGADWPPPMAKALREDFELICKDRKSQPLSPANKANSPENIFIEECAVVEPENAEAAKVLVISTDGRNGSATIHQDADIYRIRLKPGTTVTHELKSGRGAWLHIAEGALDLNGVGLTTGDGASTEEPGTLTLTANQQSEAILFDLK